MDRKILTQDAQGPHGGGRRAGGARVFLTGGTGFVGARLLRDLLRRGDRVVALTRDARRLRGEDGLEVVEGDPSRAGPWQERLAGCDAVVCLAGEPVAGQRLSAAVRERAERSRVGAAEVLVAALARTPEELRPRVLLTASAIGYYGDRGDEVLTEESAPGQGFLAELCVRWEAAARGAEPLGLRVAPLRLGVVLGEGGGALAKMLPAFRLFLGGPLGSGRQQLSWVHLSDATGLFLLALDRDDAAGPINVTAPAPVTMGELAAALGRALRRPAALPVPAPLLRLALGEGAGALLGSQRVLPRRAQALGYRFRFPDLPSALSDLVRPPAHPW